MSSAINAIVSANNAQSGGRAKGAEVMYTARNSEERFELGERQISWTYPVMLCSEVFLEWH